MTKILSRVISFSLTFNQCFAASLNQISDPYTRDKNLSLYEIISATIVNTPHQKANELSVRAQIRDYEAEVKRYNIPSISLYGSSQRSEADSSGYLSRSALGISVSKRFDFGASDAAAEAQKEQALASQALLNSTDALTRNTKGALAEKAFGIYVSIAATIATIDSYQRRINNLNRLFVSLGSEDDVTKVRNSLLTAQTEQNRYLNALVNQKLLLKHISYIDVPDDVQFQSLERANEQMKSDLQKYMDIQIAIEEAKKRNQEFVAVSHILNSANKRVEATEKSHQPSVTLSGGLDNSRMTGMDATSRSKWIGITLSKTIGGGQDESLNAAKDRAQAAQNNVQFRLEEMSFQIESNIKKIPSQDTLVSSYQSNLQRYNQQTEDFFRDHVGQGKILSSAQVVEILNHFNDSDVIESKYYDGMITGIQYRYALEVTVGILFETIGLPANFTQTSQMKF